MFGKEEKYDTFKIIQLSHLVKAYLWSRGPSTGLKRKKWDQSKSVLAPRTCSDGRCFVSAPSHQCDDSNLVRTSDSTPMAHTWRTHAFAPLHVGENGGKSPVFKLD